MKSKLFQDHPDVSKKFSDHLSIVAKLQPPAAIRDQLPSILSRFVFAPTTRDEAKVIAELRASWSVSAEELEALFGVGQFFLRSVADDETADAIIDDLPELTQLSTQDAEQLRPFVAALIDEARRSFKKTRQILRTQASGLKIIQGISHFVDLRAVLADADDSDARHKTGDHKIDCLVPVAIVRLRFDDDENVTFQMDARTLDLVLEDLMELKGEFQATIAFVPADKVHPGRRREP